MEKCRIWLDRWRALNQSQAHGAGRTRIQPFWSPDHHSYLAQLLRKQRKPSGSKFFFPFWVRKMRYDSERKGSSENSEKINSFGSSKDVVKCMSTFCILSSSLGTHWCVHFTHVALWIQTCQLPMPYALGLTGMAPINKETIPTCTCCWKHRRKHQMYVCE